MTRIDPKKLEKLIQTYKIKIELLKEDEEKYLRHRQWVALEKCELAQYLTQGFLNELLNLWP